LDRRRRKRTSKHDRSRERRSGTAWPAEEHLAAGKLPDAFGRRYLLDFDTEELPQHRFDVLVVGSGIAGLTAALSIGPDSRVGLLTKARLTDTGTWYAQGGIAGAVGEADSVELHLADTLVVGQGLCDETVVRTVVEEAAEVLAELEAFGMHFDVGESGEVSLAREGGHSLPRVLHSGDTTGAAIQDALVRAVLAADHVGVFEEHFLVDLLTAGERCAGAIVLDGATGRPAAFWADSVVLATGGCGQIFRISTNPTIATGDGLAAAWRAGAEVTDVEFVQFHPTALDHDEHPKSLITEALRGDGAYLLDCEGNRFMRDVHPLAELAPRDVVSQQIMKVIARCRQPHVWLDARHLGATHLKERFPTIWERCLEAGYDLSSDLVPVAPAAHYMVGGVRIDLDGRTSVPGLFATGEVTASGLHGANRLASNSLLEGVVFSRRIARALHAEKRPERLARIVSGPAEKTAAFTIVKARESVQEIMTDFVGMSRSEGGLAEATTVLEGMSRLLEVSMRRTEELEVQNMVTVAGIVTHAARIRTESRGTHRRLDHPARDDKKWAVHIVWSRGATQRFVPVARAASGLKAVP